MTVLEVPGLYNKVNLLENKLSEISGAFHLTGKTGIASISTVAVTLKHVAITVNKRK